MRVFPKRMLYLCGFLGLIFSTSSFSFECSSSQVQQDIAAIQNASDKDAMAREYNMRHDRYGQCNYAQADSFKAQLTDAYNQMMQSSAAALEQQNGDANFCSKANMQQVAAEHIANYKGPQASWNKDQYKEARSQFKSDVKAKCGSQSDQLLDVYNSARKMERDKY